MKKSYFSFGIGGIIVIVVVIVVGALLEHFWNEDESESEIFISQQCENLRDECLTLCFPDDGFCIEECNREYNMCRNSGTSQALQELQDMVDRLKAIQSCRYERSTCIESCYAKVIELSTNSDGTFNTDVLTDSNYQQELQLASECRLHCLTDYDECMEGLVEK